MVNRCRHEWCIRLYRFSNFSDCYYHGYFYWFKWIFNEFKSSIILNGTFRYMPSVFSKLHNKYKTPYVAIIFLVAITLIAPWLGRTALTWIVDMSSTGVSIAYFIT